MRWSIAVVLMLAVVRSSAAQSLSGPDQLRAWMSMVASDAQQGRALASREHRVVTDALAAAATSLGLTDVDRRGGRPLPLVQLSVGKGTSLSRAPRPQLPGVDITPLYPVEWGYPAQRRKVLDNAEVVRLGSVGAETQTFKGYNGQIVLVDPPKRANGLVDHDVIEYLPRLAGLKSAAAIGIVSLDITPRSYIDRQTAPRFALVEPPLLHDWPPIFLLTKQNAEAALSGSVYVGDPRGRGRLEFHVEERSVNPAARNRTFLLEGSDPRLKDEYVVLSAPSDYKGVLPSTVDADSIFNGANDGGSGAVALLGVAQQLLQSGVRPKRSILFVWHAGTEHGLMGSRWFVREPPVPLRRIVGVINVERLGRGGDTLYAVGNNETPHTLRGLLDTYASSSNSLLDWSWDTPSDPYQRPQRSDHVSYVAAGIPAVTINAGIDEAWRTVRDEIDHIDFARYAARIAWLTGAVRAVADAPQKATMLK
jgi:hypothetical protein